MSEVSLARPTQSGRPLFRYDAPGVEWAEFFTPGIYYGILDIDLKARAADMLAKFFLGIGRVDVVTVAMQKVPNIPLHVRHFDRGYRCMVTFVVRYEVLLTHSRLPLAEYHDLEHRRYFLAIVLPRR